MASSALDNSSRHGQFPVAETSPLAFPSSQTRARLARNGPAIAALGEGRMRRSWLWGLGLTWLVGLSAVSGRAWADDDDDKPAPGPRAHYGRGPGLMDRLFQP